MVGRQLRPLSLGDVFDEGFDLYKRNFPLLALVTVVLLVPFDIVVTALQDYYFKDQSTLAAMSGNSDPDVVFSALGPVLGHAGVEMLLMALLYSIPLCALAKAASHRYLGEAVSLRQAYETPLRRLLGVFWTALLYTLALAIGLFFCGLGALWPAVVFLFTAHVFVMEGKTGGQALKRSSELASGYAGRVLAVLFFLLLIDFIMAVGIQVPLAYLFDTILRIAPGGHTLFLSGDPLHANSIRGQVVSQVSSGLSDLLIAPFALSVVTVLYFDLRVRKEAFDIELLARDLGYAPVPAIAKQPPASLPPAPPLAAPGMIRGPR